MAVGSQSLPAESPHWLLPIFVSLRGGKRQRDTDADPYPLPLHLLVRSDGSSGGLFPFTAFHHHLPEKASEADAASPGPGAALS